MHKQASPAPVAAENPFDHYDREILPRDNSPVAIARVRAKSDYLKANSIGDRVSLDPKQAKWLERHGVVAVEVATVLPSEIRAAGGVDKWIKENPKAYLLTSAQRDRLGQIPGIPTPQEKRKPWDFEEV